MIAGLMEKEALFEQKKAVMIDRPIICNKMLAL